MWSLDLLRIQQFIKLLDNLEFRHYARVSLLIEMKYLDHNPLHYLQVLNLEKKKRKRKKK